MVFDLLMCVGRLLLFLLTLDVIGILRVDKFFAQVFSSLLQMHHSKLRVHVFGWKTLLP